MGETILLGSKYIDFLGFELIAAFFSESEILYVAGFSFIVLSTFFT